MVKLIRKKREEEPARGLKYWFESPDGRTVVSFFDQPSNVHMRIVINPKGKDIIRRDIGFPFAYPSNKSANEVKHIALKYISEMEKE